MATGEGRFPNVGRQRPAKGAHIYLGQPNVFFVTVDAKNRHSWLGTADVQSELVRIWRAKKPLRGAWATTC